MKRSSEWLVGAATLQHVAARCNKKFEENAFFCVRVFVAKLNSTTLRVSKDVVAAISQALSVSHNGMSLAAFAEAALLQATQQIIDGAAPSVLPIVQTLRHQAGHRDDGVQSMSLVDRVAAIERQLRAQQGDLYLRAAEETQPAPRTTETPDGEKKATPHRSATSPKRQAKTA